MLTKPHPEAIEQDTSDYEVIVRPRSQASKPAPIAASNRAADAIGTVLVVGAMALALGWAIGDRTGQSGAKSKIESAERSAQLANLKSDKLSQEKAQFCQGVK